MLYLRQIGERFVKPKASLTMNQPDDTPHDPHKAADHFFSPDNMIAVYTVLRILLKMRQHFGLEAMLEYKEKYLESFESKNPEVKTAVTRAIVMMNIEKIYGEIIGKKRE